MAYSLNKATRSQFMKCLTTNNIQPWFYPAKQVYEKFKEWSGKPEKCFQMNLDLSIYERLRFWEQYLVDKIAPSLHTEMLSIFGGSRTGTWQKSWQVDEARDDYTDKGQIEAILSNTAFHHTFLSEIKSLRVLNKIVVPDPKAKKMLKRQIYVGAIACLETYLSDAFINTVLSNKIYLKSFFTSFRDFKNQKLGMNDLLDFADKAEDINLVHFENWSF